MRMSLRSLRGWTGKLLRFGESLLVPEADRCAGCGSACRQYADRSLRLCARCSARIPWIEQVACAVCGRAERCGDCSRRTGSPLVLSRSAVRYDEAMKQWLALYKYRRDERLQALLAGMMLRAWNTHRSAYLSDGPFDAVTFVPVSRERLEQRGFDQARQLAAAFAAQAGLPVVRALRRSRDTSRQSGKSRAERLADMADAFAPEPDGLRPLLAAVPPTRPVRLLLVDDVYTTGSTMHHCARAICASTEARVYGLTWAR